MKRLVCFTVAFLFVGGFATSAKAVPLTNSSVAVGQVCALFNCGAPVATAFDTFSFAPAPDPDGNSAITVLAGLPGTAAAGMFLYNYDLLNFTTSTETLHGYSVDFAGLVTTLDINGDGIADSSWFCSTCGGIPGSVGAGTLAPSIVDFTGSSLAFLFPSGIPASGLITADYGAVSISPPISSTALVLNTVSTDQPATLVPVPEPGSLFLLGSGLLGLGAWGWGRKRLKSIKN